MPTPDQLFCDHYWSFTMAGRRCDRCGLEERDEPLPPSTPLEAWEQLLVWVASLPYAIDKGDMLGKMRVLRGGRW